MQMHAWKNPPHRIGPSYDFKIDRMLRPQGRNFEGAPSAPDNVETAAVATIRQYRNVIWGFLLISLLFVQILKHFWRILLQYFENVLQFLNI